MRRSIIFAIITLNCPILLSAQELITNGSFENTAGTFVPDGNRVMRLLAGSTVIPGWTTTNAELVWGTNQNPFALATPYGSLFLDLTGYRDAPPYGGVAQTIATVSNRAYRFSLSLGVNLDVVAYRGPTSVSAVVGSVTNSFTFAPPGVRNQWMTFTQSFTASASSTPVTIIGSGSAGGGYLGLDNLSLMQQSSGQELLSNGSFEDIRGFVNGGNGVMSLPASSTTIPGWTVTNAEIAWGTNSNPFGIITPFGGMFLDLTGFHDGLPYGGVRQTAATTPGEDYRFSFALGAFQDTSAFAGPMSASIFLGSTSNSVMFTLPARGTGDLWMTFTSGFIANAATTPVIIVGAMSAGGQYLGLDNVSVVPVSGLRITQVEKLGNNLRLSFASEAGKTYAIQSRADLASGTWATLAGTTNAGTGSIVQTTVTNAFTAPQQFYRVEQLP